MSYPKISIVTPSFNSGRFLEETILSVLNQNYPNLEYIIIDGGSSDNSTDIIRKYQQHLKYWVSEKDKGMYAAINKGFSQATGDIYAYINADDIYLPGTFEKIAKVFSKYNEVRWLKGITNYIDESSKMQKKGRCLLYNQKWIQQGVYGRDAYFIQQDSVFWRSSLWKAAGGIDTGLKMAGDYSLWIKFAQTDILYTLKAEVSCFRKVLGQKSQDYESYLKEYNLISIPYLNRRLIDKIKHFFVREPKMKFRISKVLYYFFCFGMPHYHQVDIENNIPVIKRKYYHISDSN